MARYILRYKGTGNKPEGDLDRIRKSSALAVVDESPRMLLVEGDDETIGHLSKELADWLVTPQKPISVPDPRQRIRRPIE